MTKIYESLLFLAWSLTIVHYLFERKTSSSWIGIIITPITLLIQAFACFYLPEQLQQSSPLIPALKSNWLIMHVSVMLLSYATLVCGSLFCIAFIWLSIFSEASQFNIIYTVSDKIGLLSNPKNYLERIDQLSNEFENYSYRLIGLGFPFLTLGILSGSIWANEAWGSYWSWDPKETWALITWLIFAIYLHTRYIYKWKGLRSAILGSIGFFIVWICYIGVNLLGKGLHSYGWFL